MSTLRSALEEWVNEDAEHLHLDQLADDLVELEHVSGFLEVERLRRISTFEERSGPHHFGYPIAHRIPQTPLWDGIGSGPSSGGSIPRLPFGPGNSQSLDSRPIVHRSSWGSPRPGDFLARAIRRR